MYCFLAREDIMKITKIVENGKIVAYKLENENGMSVQIGTMGAALQRVDLPDGQGGTVNVCLNFEDMADYAGNTLYAGASVAPVAGRIAGSRFAIGNKIYPLTANDRGFSCLHGGTICASFLEWIVMQAYARDGVAKVGLTTILPDDLEGFPGTRIFSATYTLDNENRLTVDYDAVSDRDTYVNMTNHAYFNFSGDFSQSAWNQKLTIAAPNYMQLDEKNWPVGLDSVEDSPFDFREGKTIKAAVDAYPDNVQVVNGKGIDHAFDVREAAVAGEVLLQMEDEASGRGVKIKSTSGQCMVVYSGGFIGDAYKLDGGVQSSDRCAIALECQAFPNAINMPELDPQILEANERYHHTIQYEFMF